MRNQAKKEIGVLLLTLLLTLVLSACGGAGDNSASGGQNTAANASANANAGSAGNAGTAGAEGDSGTPQADASKDEGTLTVYLNDFDDIIADMFEQATGYKVNLVTGNGAEIMSRIEAEKGNPHWDVVWADMMPSINALGKQGQLLEGWTPNNAANLTEAYRSYVPENQSYYPTGAHAAGVIVYNKDSFTEEQAPKTWSDFAKPEYKDQIAAADPAIAAPAYPFVAQFFEKEGMGGGKALFDSWFNNGLRVYPKNPQVVQALSSGEVKAAALQESNAYSMLAAGEPIGIVWPEEGAPASVRVAAIQKDTKNPNAAKAFIEFLLDPSTQQQLINKGEEAYFEPSAAGAKPKENRDPNAKLIAADAAWAAEHEAEIKQWFADKAVK
ncbi:extracellular solute-binding protein [Paenibacillus macerans]|uniref:extracellular solute-binding protein n=1 Tax=Paenibacillus macerans TaxID=44252 RepID=UPI003D31A297